MRRSRLDAASTALGGGHVRAHCQAAGPQFAVALTFDRKCDGRRWIAHGAKCDPKGWGGAQLVAVIRYIQGRIKAGRGERESLTFSRLIGCQGLVGQEALRRFEERLLMTREAHSRTKGRRGRPTVPVDVRASDGRRGDLKKFRLRTIAFHLLRLHSRSRRPRRMSTPSHSLRLLNRQSVANERASSRVRKPFGGSRSASS